MICKTAPIVNFSYINKIRNKLGKIVCVSGGFDPIHPGHLYYIQESKKLGDTLIAVINGDDYLKRKKWKFFMDLQTRSKIISFIKGIDYVIPFEIKNDHTVNKALEKLKPHIFTNGGDRKNSKTIPEWNVCKRLDIRLITGLTLKPKNKYSSSKYLEEWGEFWCKRNPGKNK